MNSDEYRRIVESYRVNHSLSATAAETGFSTGKVMRVLITEGLWESPMSREVARLHSEGYSAAEIAEMMDRTVGNVQAYMPYSKEAIEDGGGREAGQRAEANERMIQIWRTFTGTMITMTESPLPGGRRRSTADRMSMPDRVITGFSMRSRWNSFRRHILMQRI